MVRSIDQPEQLGDSRELGPSPPQPAAACHPALQELDPAWGSGHPDLSRGDHHQRPGPYSLAYYVREISPATTSAQYGIAEVTETTEMVPMTAMRKRDQWGNPIPPRKQ